MEIILIHLYESMNCNLFINYTEAFDTRRKSQSEGCLDVRMNVVFKMFVKKNKFVELKPSKIFIMWYFQHVNHQAILAVQIGQWPL